MSRLARAFSALCDALTGRALRKTQRRNAAAADALDSAVKEMLRK